MSEEENKAIKSLNDFAYTIHGTLSVGESKTILNLIKNLQKENTLAKETIKNHCSDMDKVNNILAKLQKENEDWQRAYQEEKDTQFNMLINSKCGHCGKEKPLYCEKCYQELISKNAKLQFENEELKENYKVLENAYMIDSIPKSVIQDKIEKFRCKLTWGYNDWKYDEKIYQAEHKIIDDIEKELLNKGK